LLQIDGDRLAAGHPVDAVVVADREPGVPGFPEISFPPPRRSR
jgi:hypothetical protein